MIPSSPSSRCPAAPPPPAHGPRTAPIGRARAAARPADDPEGDGGNGIAIWTRDPAQAMTFAAGEAAVTCYRAVPLSCPLRADGKPNCPLTMFTVVFW
jgi:hypothetical protein